MHAAFPPMQLHDETNKITARHGASARSRDFDEMPDSSFGKGGNSARRMNVIKFPCLPTRRFACERALDLTISMGLLVDLSPLFIATMLFIKLTSRGPVIFKQKRIGKGGKPFTLFKFRTMHTASETRDHESHVKSLMREGQPMIKLDTIGDRRIIPLGKLLRSLAIDELPQLVNVLKGEMSIVGPRPCLPSEFGEYTALEKSRLRTPPGLTGLWQVSGKNALTFEEMVNLDREYSQSKNAIIYMKIILKTPMVLAQQTIALGKPNKNPEVPLTVSRRVVGH